GCHPAKMSGSRRAFKLFRESINRHISRETPGIHLFNRGSENVVYVVISQKSCVFGQIPGITFVVLSWSELCRINENGNNDNITHPAGFAHQTQMALVQCAHGGNQPNGSILLAANFARDGTHALTAV